MPSALVRLLAHSRSLAVAHLAVLTISIFPPHTLYTSHTSLRESKRCNYASDPTAKATLVLYRGQHTFSRDGRGDEITARISQRDAFRLKKFLPGIRTKGDKPRDVIAALGEELQRQERVYGEKGIYRVLANFYGSELPTDDSPEAAYIWGTLIRIPTLTTALIDYAAEMLKRKGYTYPHIYELCMRHWLLDERLLRQTLGYHHQMLKVLDPPELPLQMLAQYGKPYFTARTYNAFLEMYKTSNENNLYDYIVLPLCERGLFRLALQWHIDCREREDEPSDTVADHPLIRMLAQHASGSEVQKDFFPAMNSLLSRQSTDEDVMRRLKGRDIAPVRLDDSFCARLFATSALSASSVISGLSLIGVNEIGPQAVRAMALGLDDITALPAVFGQLRAAGIALYGCVFSVAIEKFAMDNRWHLVQSMLDSDQHHEVYDDQKVQSELLHHYIEQQDWNQVHRTLAFLSFRHSDPGSGSWNILLQAYVKRVQPDQILDILQSMHHVNAQVSVQSILAIRGMLSTRRTGRRPRGDIQGDFDKLRFVTRALATILQNGIGNVVPSQWVEIIRRYGMLGRFRELRRLTLWLFHWYAPRSSAFAERAEHLERPWPITLSKHASTVDPLSVFRSHHNAPPSPSQLKASPQLRKLFPDRYHQALIVWGFWAGLLPNAPLEQSLFSTVPAKRHYRKAFRRRGVIHRLDWSVGLRLVVALRDLGLDISVANLQRTLQMIFVNLFNRRRRSNKRLNRIAAYVNRIHYAHYVNEVNKIWGDRLLGSPDNGKSKLHSQVWLPWAPRQRRPRAYLTLDEILGPNWRRTSHQKERYGASEQTTMSRDALPWESTGYGSERKS